MLTFLCFMVVSVAAAVAGSGSNSSYEDRNPALGTSVCTNVASSQVFTMAASLVLSGGGGGRGSGGQTGHTLISQRSFFFSGTNYATVCAQDSGEVFVC